ncbi:hypothetical protein [Agrilactobacillus composti]|nr:hypothetical protein [Agrilactobacillus composti]
MIQLDRIQLKFADKLVFTNLTWTFPDTAYSCSPAPMVLVKPPF